MHCEIERQILCIECSKAVEFIYKTVRLIRIVSADQLCNFNRRNNVSDQMRFFFSKFSYFFGILVWIRNENVLLSRSLTSVRDKTAAGKYERERRNANELVYSQSQFGFISMVFCNK